MHHIKLQSPPRQRLRVREVAKQVGITNHALMDLLDEFKEYAASANSYIEVPVIRQVHERFGVTYNNVRPQASAEQSQQPLMGLSPPHRRTKRENNPYKQPAKRALDVAIERQEDRWDDPLRWRRRDRPPAERPAVSEEQQWSSTAAGGASAAFEFLEWKIRGFSETERDVWVGAGLPTNRASVAAQMRDAGLAPIHLATDLDGWTVLDRITRGASGVSIVRLLRLSKKESG